MRAICFLLGVCAMMNPILSPGAAPEFRAVWVTRFEWTSADAEAIRSRITQILDTVEENNLNAVVFQIRGEAETLYPSEIEPWSPLVGGKDPGLDPVAFAIDEAHKRGLEFHAYINPMPLLPTRQREAPSDPDHLWNRHGPDSDEPWVCMNAEGEPARSEYVYLHPGVPGVQTYLREVILDVVRRYDVDGIHLDRIRSPGYVYGHNPIADARFRGRGNPDLLEWADWQRAQLDKFVNDLAAEMRRAKPRVVLSCAAWGIYNRHHIDGYINFSSGYHDYYQDTWNWVRIGAMDVLMPMIYWDIPDPQPNYDELMKDFIRGVGQEHFVGGQRTHGPEENVAEVLATREAGALGTVLFSVRSAERRGILAALKEQLYQEKAPTPSLQRLDEPRYGVVLGTVTDENGAPLVDAWVSLDRDESERSSRRRGRAPRWTTGADGRFAFLDVPAGPVTVSVEYPGAESAKSDPVEIAAGEVAEIGVTVPGAAEALKLPFLEVMSPSDGRTIDGDSLYVIGRTEPSTAVRVNDAPVEVASTGAFAVDGIPVAQGENVVVVEATDANGSTSARRLTLRSVEREPEAPRTTLQMTAPGEDLALLPGDILSIRAVGPPARTGYAVVFDESARLPLAEERDRDGNPTGVYQAAVRVPEGPYGRPVSARVVLEEDGDRLALEAESSAEIEIWDRDVVRVGECTGRGGSITHGLHTVRLGGPYLGSVPGGTRFEVVGREGSDYRVRLSASRTGWISTRRVNLLPEGTTPPHNYFTSCSIDGNDEVDIVGISLRDPVVFAVSSDTAGGNRIYLDLFDTHHATTWISHKTGARNVVHVSADQMEDDWVRVTITLRSRENWGYWTETDGNLLRLFVRRPPQIAEPPASPLEGRVIALEAGHGGPGNSGAVGRFGTQEKTVNLMAVEALRDELERRGAKTVLVRPKDSSISLWERVERANEADAELFISIHANATGSRGRFLQATGTSTYYTEAHCHRLAEILYRKLLGLGWEEFGVVGNFSYYPLRNSRIPAVLVEQAFMSNPYDEARLTDPAYHAVQAKALADGLEEFLDSARE